MFTVLTLALSLLAGAPATPVPVDCGMDAPLALPVSIGDIGAQSVTCTATCDELPDLSCTAQSCTAVQRDCSIPRRGYIECDGVRTYCNQPCPVCNDGDFRSLRTGNCCSYPDEGELTHFQQCVNGQWQTTSSLCRPNLNCISW